MHQQVRRLCGVAVALFCYSGEAAEEVAQPPSSLDLVRLPPFLLSSAPMEAVRGAVDQEKHPTLYADLQSCTEPRVELELLGSETLIRFDPPLEQQLVQPTRRSDRHTNARVRMCEAHWGKIQVRCNKTKELIPLYFKYIEAHPEEARLMVSPWDPSLGGGRLKEMAAPTEPPEPPVATETP